MDKKIAGLLGAVAAVTTMAGAQAATQAPANPSSALRASSYADLLMPVPNAAEALVADNELLTQGAKRPAGVKVAEEHHHHHHSVVIIKKHRRHYHHHHHHHHHHHSGAYIGVPGVGVHVHD